MIQIIKGAAPTVLLTKGVQAAQQHCDEYDSAPDDYQSSKKKFKILKTIYGHKSVKSALMKAQKKKCAFCESFFLHTGYGDVEHYRPKGAYQQDAAETKLNYPGYYWLAYEWSNLFFSCQICNQQFKKNLFPLQNPNQRARYHKANLALEKPLLINPADDPSVHIGFRKEYAFAVNDSAIGKTTIDVMGLNREIIAEDRRRYLARLRDLKDLHSILSSMPPESLTDWHSTRLEECNISIVNHQTASAEYTSMARAFLGS